MPVPLLNWWVRQRLASRLLWSSVLLVLAMLVLLFALVQGLIKQQAERQLSHELHAAERVWRSLLTQESTRLLDAATLLAANHEMRRALGRKDTAQMETALAREGERVGAQITAVLDTDLRLQVSNPMDAMFMLWIRHSAYPQMARSQQGLGSGGAEGRAPSWLQEPDALTGLLQALAEHATRDRQRSVLALLGGAPYRFVVAPMVEDRKSVV